ncbi:MAG: hypothetical protein JXA77_10645 [Bacteroidales bacterium]|nr:hypothetical protein [Bacteroidales bacterium]MBN2820533.1 hypothetical protein [Bacteroidales bacterium]
MFLILTNPNSTFAQDSSDYGSSKHIAFTQPLGIILLNPSLGYEYQTPKKISYTFIIDAYKSSFDSGDTIHDTFGKIIMYNGVLFRPGIKFRTFKGFSHSIEAYYKYSWYNNNMVLKYGSDGEEHDIYYLESKSCNSYGLSYKLAYDYYLDSKVYLSPFISLGARARFDSETIYGKYEGGTGTGYWGDGKLDNIEYAKERWIIPIFRIGLMAGYRF